MKLSDGGFRPCYNVQLASDVDSRVILGVAVTNEGTDQHQCIPMLDQLERRTGQLPVDVLLDGGYATQPTIDHATRRGVRPLAPVPTPRGTRPAHVPRETDSLSTALWRVRMGTEAAQASYRARAATAEWVHADARIHRTLTQLGLRGLHKVHTWALWAALAHNMIRAMGIVPHLMT